MFDSPKSIKKRKEKVRKNGFFFLCLVNIEENQI